MVFDVVSGSARYLNWMTGFLEIGMGGKAIFSKGDMEHNIYCKTRRWSMS